MNIGLLLIAIVIVVSVYGDEFCPHNELLVKNIIDDSRYHDKVFVNRKLLSCKSEIDKKFCCYDMTRLSEYGDTIYYCCSESEHNHQIGVVHTVTVVMSIVTLAIIASCVVGISCMCCSFCPVYRHRNARALYVQADHSVQLRPLDSP